MDAQGYVTRAVIARPFSTRSSLGNPPPLLYHNGEAHGETLRCDGHVPGTDILHLHYNQYQCDGSGCELSAVICPLLSATVPDSL